MKIACIVGGTGSLAKALLKQLLHEQNFDRIRILSRGEHRQMEMQETMQGLPVDFLVGDCRDLERMCRATEGCHTVFHFAAMKSVDKAEYDPNEAVLTNITGTRNVLRACVRNKVAHAIFTSTDKAVAPVNLYGATKLVAEKLWIAGNIGNHKTKFSVCRYGNVLNSQGSVIEKWFAAARESRPIKVTNGSMTRFFITVERAAEFVKKCSEIMKGGEVFIPKMKSTTMWDLASVFQAMYGCEISNMEVRPGEKLHECLISDDETADVTELADYFIRWPDAKLFPFEVEGIAIKHGFTSYSAKRFTKEELREMIQCALALSQKSVVLITENGTTASSLSKNAPKQDLMLSSFNSFPM